MMAGRRGTTIHADTATNKARSADKNRIFRAYTALFEGLVFLVLLEM
jgi:hypothetical protein